MTNLRPLNVFLCHSSQDKPAVQRLYQRLSIEGWISPWLDVEKLIPGQDWNYEITRAVRSADVILVCLSRSSITKEGYIQREINMALDIAKEKPKGTIFVIPLKLEDCDIPEDLNKWQWINYFSDQDISNQSFFRDRLNESHQKLLDALKLRTRSLPDVANLLERSLLGGKAEYEISNKNFQPRCLRVFISYGSDAVEVAHNFYERFNSKEWIVPWIRDINLIGADHELTNYRLNDAISYADMAFVLVSEKYMYREGFHQKEIREIRNNFLVKPEGWLYMVIVKVDNIQELPNWLKDTNYFIDYWGDNKEAALQQMENLMKEKAVQLEITPK